MELHLAIAHHNSTFSDMFCVNLKFMEIQQDAGIDELTSDVDASSFLQINLTFYSKQYLKVIEHNL